MTFLFGKKGHSKETGPQGPNAHSNLRFRDWYNMKRTLACYNIITFINIKHQKRHTVPFKLTNEMYVINSLTSIDKTRKIQTRSEVYILWSREVGLIKYFNN